MMTRSLGWSQDLLEQMFEDGKFYVQLEGWQVLFHVDCKFFHQIFPFQINSSAILQPLSSRCWVSDGVLVSRHVPGEEDTNLESPEE